MNPAVPGALKVSLLAARMEQTGPAVPLRDLTIALAAGNDTAWVQFHRDYGPIIFRQLLAATRGDHHLASEALQHSYLRVARHVRACESEPMFLGWLRIVARTALSDCRRRQLSFWQLLQRRGKEMLTETSEAEEEQLQSSLDRALAQLDVADRTLLEAKYFSGRSVKQIAEILAVTPKAVESRLVRARTELRRHLLAALARHES